MTRILLVEDDRLIAENLCAFLRQEGFETAAAATAAEALALPGPWDLALLDVALPDGSGLDVCRALRRDNDAVQIVFITGYSDYIADGYEVEALHYLMKPVDEAKLDEVLDRAADKLRKNERTLTLELSGELVRLPVYQIRSAEVQGNYVTVHAKTDYTAKMTLSELEAQLDDHFFRLGRSALVNLGCVARVTRTTVVLTDGSALPLPRGAYDRINRAIIQRG